MQLYINVGVDFYWPMFIPLSLEKIQFKLEILEDLQTQKLFVF